MEVCQIREVASRAGRYAYCAGGVFCAVVFSGAEAAINFFSRSAVLSCARPARAPTPIATIERRAAILVLDVQLRAFFRQESDHLIATRGRRAVQRPYRPCRWPR